MAVIIVVIGMTIIGCKKDEVPVPTTGPQLIDTLIVDTPITVSTKIVRFDFDWSGDIDYFAWGYTGEKIFIDKDLMIFEYRLDSNKCLTLGVGMNWVDWMHINVYIDGVLDTVVTSDSSRIYYAYYNKKD